MNDMTTPPAKGLQLPASPLGSTSDFSLLMEAAKFEQLWRVSKLFASSDMVPVQYQGKPENVFVASQAAMRLAVDPFMFMQHCPVIHGRPGLDGQMAIALINQRGPFNGPIQWRFEGAGKQRKCTAYAVHARTGDLCELTIEWATVEGEGWVKNQKWTTMADQMFRYRTAAWLGRAYCPEVLMGLPTSDELEDIVFGNAKTIEGETSDKAEIALPRAKAVDAPPPAAERVDKETGEVTGAPKAETKSAEPETKGPAAGTEAPKTDGFALGKKASDAQRRMIMDIAKRGGLSVAQLDEHLIEKFSMGIDELPMGLVSEATQLVRTLTAVPAK